MFKKGFTLIELLIVMGVLAVLAAGLIALLDPIDKINAANDTKAISDISQIAAAEGNYAATHGGCYSPSIANLVTVGEFKSPGPTAASNYAYTTVLPVVDPTCPTPTDLKSVVWQTTLRSKRYTSLVAPAGPHHIWDSLSAQTCDKAAATNTCP